MRCRRTKAGRRVITLICARTRQGRYVEALELLRDAQRHGHPPGRYVLPSLLRACGGLSDLNSGEKLHGFAVRSSFVSDAFVGCALIDMYCRCGCIDSARKVFDFMPKRDAAVWNSMVSGYVRLGFAGDSMRIFRNMILGGVEADSSTWNSLIFGFSSAGDVRMALYLSRTMGVYGVEPDVFSWTSLISGFVRSFHNREAFETFRQMTATSGVRPSSVTISSLLPACASVADGKCGMILHGYAVVIGVHSELFVSSSLVDMYAKCGFISDAVNVFAEMTRKSTVSWNSMIFGYANNGYCGDAINLYHQMENDGVKPDHLTLTAVLTACSHAGMVGLGRALFHSMQKEYGIQPRLEHYACMVDLLGRAGHLVEAYNLIKEIPMEADLFVWGALLGACRNHGNVELAKLAASHLVKLETEKCGSYLMMSNILADAGRQQVQIEAVMTESSFYRSPPVESVQELVRRDPTRIPDEYVRDDDDHDEQGDAVQPHHFSSLQLPVVDLSLLSGGHPDEAHKLDMACREWGFFQVVNHGVDEELLLKTKDVTDKFFELPFEEKLKHSLDTERFMEGYGRSYAGPKDQKRDWGDMLMLMVYPEKFRSSKYWPSSPPEFMEVIEAFSAEVNRVAREILAALSLLMGMNRDGLLELHKEVVQVLRANYYPPCCKPHQVVGISPHSDACTITLLLQDDQTTGLQIQHAGKWAPVQPIPNALVANVGDVLEIWSNGRYKSIEHRAMPNSARARISLASFVCLNSDAEIEPLEAAVGGAGHTKMYGKIKYGDYVKRVWETIQSGKTKFMQRVKLQSEYSQVIDHVKE
ncbi:hypothetical protein Taro_030517 [Colocasia esculenta]|uniref:Fe2OG dioxygenase domain-containing protein n=1 Tax=Colocasia esculenta TaxID=4460 RepID=A0A843VLL5_COLES|nr:hypothetical protein [Colocasia esculenta]